MGTFSGDGQVHAVPGRAGHSEVYRRRRRWRQWHWVTRDGSGCGALGQVLAQNPSQDAAAPPRRMHQRSVPSPATSIMATLESWALSGPMASDAGRVRRQRPSCSRSSSGCRPAFDHKQRLPNTAPCPGCGAPVNSAARVHHRRVPTARHRGAQWRRVGASARWPSCSTTSARWLQASDASEAGCRGCG
jgi:hypothetical protein